MKSGTPSKNDFLEVYGALKRELGAISSQELKKYKFGRNQMHVVSSLMRFGPLSTSDLAELTQSDPASTTRTVQALDKLGWIKKVADTKDQRRTLVELTAKGQKHAGKVHAIRETITEQVKKTVSKKELDETVRLLTKIVYSLQQAKKQVNK
jgi:DNA-binding MarR family transcriptional regulator